MTKAYDGDTLCQSRHNDLEVKIMSKYVRKTDKSKARYSLKFAGTYRRLGNNGTETVENYEHECILGQEHIEAGALHVFVKYIVPEVMPKKYPGFIKLVTHEIVVNEPVDGTGAEVTPNIMTLQQLWDFIKQTGMPVRVELYADRDSLCQAVLDCEADEEAFLKNQDNQVEIKSKGLSLVAGLAKINSESAPAQTEVTRTYAPVIEPFAPPTVPVVAPVAPSEGEAMSAEDKAKIHGV